MSKTIRKKAHECKTCGKKITYCKCRVTRYPTNPRRLPTMAQQERAKMEWDHA